MGSRLSNASFKLYSMNLKFLKFKKENNFKKENFQFELTPYWGIAVCAALLITIFSLFFCYRLFMKIKEDKILGTADAGNPIPEVRGDRMKKALDYFSEREKESIEILNAPAPIVDPSR